MKIIVGPDREPDSIVGPFWFYYNEHICVNTINQTAAYITVDNGRVCIIDEKDGPIDMGNLIAVAYMDYLLNKAGLSTHKTDSK